MRGEGGYLQQELAILRLRQQQQVRQQHSVDVRVLVLEAHLQRTWLSAMHNTIDKSISQLCGSKVKRTFHHKLAAQMQIADSSLLARLQASPLQLLMHLLQAGTVLAIKNADKEPSA